jgi:predicted dehydrogenase
MSKIGVAVVGCGLIGSRRAATAAADPRCELRLVVDTNKGAAEPLAQKYGARAASDWRAVLDDGSIAIVVAATPNAFLREVAVAALDSGKHVLVEKPMGKDVADAAAIAAAAQASGKILKVGFNHRYHAALMKARDLFTGGAIGALINIRARYGHGARPGYEREWRGDPALAGGGELTDQGAHLIDLILWLAGRPREAFAYTQTAVWPISPLEDNAFALMRFDGGPVASVHASWTQWKNLFSFEIFGATGSLAVEGLGGSYGPQRLTVTKRNPDGGVPQIEEIAFEGDDRSWALEWQDFMGAVLDGKPYWGTPADGVAVMEIVDALYASARAKAPIEFA